MKNGKNAPSGSVMTEHMKNVQPRFSYIYLWLVCGRLKKKWNKYYSEIFNMKDNFLMPFNFP